ncbi:hypothetical protein MBLNU459_g7379t1 [Dothideomycetes sp. NU459]
MFAIQKRDVQSASCNPNILPCKIAHNGPVNAARRHWAPQRQPDGKTAAYFRGRELHGKVIDVPNGYKGVVVEKTARTLPAPDARHSGLDGRDEAEEDDEECSEYVGVMQELASFKEFTVWGHESVPANVEDSYTKGIEEWMGFAQSMHSYDEK